MVKKRKPDANDCHKMILNTPVADRIWTKTDMHIDPH